MRIEKRTMNWLPRTSLYNEQAQIRARRQAAHQQFLSSQSTLASAIGNIMTSSTQGTTEIVSSIALKRLGYTKKA